MSNNRFLFLSCIICPGILFGSEHGNLPELPPMPDIEASETINSVKMDKAESFDELQLDIPIADGPFCPSYESIEENYPGTPEMVA